MAKNNLLNMQNLDNNLSDDQVDQTMSMLERRISSLDSKINAFILENNELHKKNGKKINRVMMMISNKRRSKKGFPTYLIIVIVVSLLALGVVGFLAFKHLKGNKVPTGSDTIKAITDSI